MISWVISFIVSKKIFFIILLRRVFIRSTSIISRFFYVYKLMRKLLKFTIIWFFSIMIRVNWRPILYNLIIELWI